jgi:hypothetical protein
MMNPRFENESEGVREGTRQFVVGWIARRHGTALDFVRELEDNVGWRARLAALEVLRELRNDPLLEKAHREFLFYTLGDDVVLAALSETASPGAEHLSTIDDLFLRSKRFRRTRDFADAVEFISKFHDYSAYNNMLVYLQNPLATYFATAAHWQKAFGRTIKEDARAMLILAPRTPVLVVYDAADTEGPRLPAKLERYGKTAGVFDPRTLDHTVKNCERERILIQRKPMGPLRGGLATVRLRDQKHLIRILVREELEPAAAYSVLCHELAHVFLGHVGACREGGWPCRANLSDAVAEIEAESVSHTVCRRAGIVTQSAEYLSNYFTKEQDLSNVSLDLISRVAGKIEEMGRRLMRDNDK